MSEVWLDGRFVPEDQAFVRATDPGFLHGRGVFETLRACGGVPFRLADHLDRLAASAAHFRIPAAKPPLDAVIRELCDRNTLPDAAVRITLSAGGHLLVTARRREPPPEAWLRDGAEVMLAPWRRDLRAPLAGHKTLSYLENVLTHEEARRRNCADALYVGLRGELIEGCVTNVFLVLDGRLVTPRLVPGILPGVTRKVVLELEKTRERTVRAKDLLRAEEAFLTNSLLEIVPVQKPPGPVTRRVMGAYRDAVQKAIGLRP
ncbi:MAG TPA: aminotransferase class IV [Planctomycetota bacterium]|nr:aminotransferase class IV [Planctomycetota bacterium]